MKTYGKQLNLSAGCLWQSFRCHSFCKLGMDPLWLRVLSHRHPRGKQFQTDDLSSNVKATTSRRFGVRSGTRRLFAVSVFLDSARSRNNLTFSIHNPAAGRRLAVPVDGNTTGPPASVQGILSCRLAGSEAQRFERSVRWHRMVSAN